MPKRDLVGELRAKELDKLRARVASRVRKKSGPKRVRRIAGIDLALTPKAGRVHVCASMLSFPRLKVLEEAIATDELSEEAIKTLGNVAFVPLIQSVLKMLKRKADVVMVREVSLKEDIPLASYVGVISGRPSFGVSPRGATPRKLAKWENLKRSGPVKIRGHSAPITVIAGHLTTFTDASRIAKACCTDARIPEPLRDAGARVRAWERAWKKFNIYGR
jgi:deoxyinosine 3'endonuclease (endonuclease V)